MSFISISSSSPSPMSLSSSPGQEWDSQYEKYEEFIRRVRPQERFYLERTLLSLENSEAIIDGLLAAIEGPWGVENPYILHEQMPYYALLAFKEGSLENYQLGTLLKFWSAFQHHKEYHQERGGAIPPFAPVGYSLFHENGMPNHEALELVFRTFFDSEDPDDEPLITIDERQKMQWVEEMRQLPRSEQRFFVLPNLLKEKTNTFSDEFDKMQYYIFRFLDRETKAEHLLPSIGMQQAFISATHTGTSKNIILNPVIGLSSLEDLRKNALGSTRDMACHFPDVFLPHSADGLYAPWHYFTDHDAYHAKRADDIGKMRVPLMQLSDQLGWEGSIDERRHQYYFRDTLIDLDFSHFRHKIYENEETFWLSFGIISHLLPKTFKPLDPKTEDQILRRICHSLSNDKKICRCLQNRFKQLKQKMAQYNPREYAIFFSSRTFKRLPVIWREEQFLKKFKTSFLEKKGKIGREKWIKKLLPLIREENVLDYLKFSIDLGQKAARITEHCVQFFVAHFHKLVESDSLKGLKEERPELAQALIQRGLAASRS